MVSTSLEMKLIILFHLKISIMGGKEKVRIMGDARNRFWNIRCDFQNP